MDHGSLGQSFSTRVHWRVGASGSADSIPENAVPRRGHHNVWPVIIRHPLSWCWWLGMPPFPAAPCGPWCPAGGGFRPKRRPRSWSRVPPAVMGKILTLVWSPIWDWNPSATISDLQPQRIPTSNLVLDCLTGNGGRQPGQRTGHKGRPAPLDPSLPVLPTPCPRPGPMLGNRSRDLSRRLYWIIVPCYCRWQILLLGHGRLSRKTCNWSHWSPLACHGLGLGKLHQIHKFPHGKFRIWCLLPWRTGRSSRWVHDRNLGNQHRLGR